MHSAWIRPVEQILLSAREKDWRVIGFTGLDDQLAISAVSVMVAETSARSGVPTLLIDLSEPAVEKIDGFSWAPGDTGIGQGIEADDRGFDRLFVRPTSDSRFRFNNVKALTETFDEELTRYERIVIDLPEVLRPNVDQVNPAASAAACDAVYMVCFANGVDRDAAYSSTALLKSAGALIGGIVMNETERVSTGEGIAISAMRCLAFAPRLANWVASRARASRLLN